ncbi:MAG TPA: helix-turn-helix transcriptional regulator [Bryobacteraceae bacterium]|jgi:DNA-binding XRE family transcriptional regulator|nr:helix-turn-helix transcriptional regulator [Bryobacteraceae bacterium]
MAAETRKDARTGKRLYNRVAVLRAERGLSRQELADAIHVNYQTIGYLERGDYQASLELAFRLTEFFGLPLGAIFSRKPFRPMSEQIYVGQEKRRAPGRGTKSARL